MTYLVFNKGLKLHPNLFTSAGLDDPLTHRLLGHARICRKRDPGRPGRPEERMERAERAEINRNQQKSASILQVLSFTNFRGIHRSSSSTCWITYFLTNCPTFLTNHVLPTDRAWHQRNPRLRWPSPISLEQTFTKTQRKTLDTQHISTSTNCWPYWPQPFFIILRWCVTLRGSGSQGLRISGS